MKSYVRAAFGLAIVANLDFIVQHDATVATIPGRSVLWTGSHDGRGRFRPPYLRTLLDTLLGGIITAPPKTSKRGIVTRAAPAGTTR